MASGNAIIRSYLQSKTITINYQNKGKTSLDEKSQISFAPTESQEISC